MLLLAPCAWAGELEEETGWAGLRGSAESYLEGYLSWEELSSGDFSAGLSSILNAGTSQAAGELRQAGRRGLMLLTVALLCGLTATLRGKEGPLDPVRLAGAVCVAAMAVADVHTLMGLGRETLTRMLDFSRLLLPVVTAACAAAGAPASAAMRQGAVLLFLQLLLELMEGLILPLIFAWVAAATAGAALGNPGLQRASALLKKASTALLSLLLSGFVLYLTVTGAVAGNADALSQKAAKTALTGLVPVVGSILSDAAETVAAGAGMLKATIGVAGLLTVLCICLVPFLRLGCHYLIYKLTAALADTLTAGPVAGLLDAMGSAFALLLGAVAGGGLILYVALITSLQAVRA